VARKTTTTTVVYSEKTSDGSWNEQSKTVTTVVERDDEGYPYGPVSYPVWTPRPYGKKRYGDLFSGRIGNYVNWYDFYGSMGAAPAAQDTPQPEPKETENDGC
jgi:hypothetical protein